MSATATLVRKFLRSDGRVQEDYTWTSSGGTTTLSVTADTTQQPEIVNIDDFAVSSNGDTAVIVARDAGATVAKMTFTANDSGTLSIIGPAA